MRTPITPSDPRSSSSEARSCLLWNNDGEARLHLGAVGIRCAEGPGASPRVHATDTWYQAADGVWRTDCDRLELAVRTGPPNSVGVTTISMTATVVVPVAIELLTLELEAPCPVPPHYLDRFMAWRPLARSASLGDYSPLLVRWQVGTGSQMELRSLQGWTTCAFSWKEQSLRLRITLDSAALHPRWRFSTSSPESTAAPVWMPGHQLHFRFLAGESPVASAGPLVVPARFPAGAEAAFTLTDHCDFDTTASLDLFLHGQGGAQGWLGRGLRLTKGAFARPSQPPDRPPAPCLQDVSYRRLIHSLCEDGSTVAPHGVNESGQIDADTFHEALGECVRAWAPRAWIDHGYLRYGYSMGGADDPEYRLLDALSQQGIDVLWSYHDVPASSRHSLNLLAPAASNALQSLSPVLGHLLRGRVLIALHYLRSAAYWHLRGRVGHLLTSSIAALRALGVDMARTRRLRRAALSRWCAAMQHTLRQSCRDAKSEPYTRRELLEAGAVVYPERAVPMSQTRSDDLLLFATLEATHLCDIYTRRALRRLIRERGVHIGHCYLLNQRRYFRGLFERRGSQLKLAPGWTQFLDALSSTVRAGVVWNPPVGELAHWMRAMRHVACSPLSGDGCRLENPLRERIENFTLLLPRSVSIGAVRWGEAAPKGWRLWPDWLAIWGDLAPESHTLVSWGEPR